MERLLILNPGSTSTKLAVYDGEQPLFVESIVHTAEELAPYDHVADQYEFRQELVLRCLEQHQIPLDSLTAIVSRGGLLTPIEAGAYEVNDDMVWQLKYKPQNEHASNMGAMIARSISKRLGIPAYIYDGVTVDELLPINKITGLPFLRRKGMGHNLNTRAAAMHYAESNGKQYKDITVIVAHLGGGITVNLHHNGKPVVAIWGVGFPDRPYNIRNIGLERLIDFLKNDPEYGGCAVMLGVPTFWRTLEADCVHDPYLHTLIKQADLVLPWTIQRFSPLLHNDMNRYRDLIIGDLRWGKDNGVAYVPAVTPGFSWHNLSKREFPDDVKPVGSIPRQGGRFYWQQLSTAMLAGAEMIYVAMFDEIDEGTAIFKCTDNPPVSDKAKFIDMDGKPSDHYLWLTGEAARMLRREAPLSLDMPARNMAEAGK